MKCMFQFSLYSDKAEDINREGNATYKITESTYV